jgi:hypothetical protein
MEKSLVSLSLRLVPQLDWGLALSVAHGDVLHWRQHLVTVVLVVVLGRHAFCELELELAEHTHDVPFKLEGGESLAGAEGAESEHGVLHLTPVLVESRVDETIVAEFLEKPKSIHYSNGVVKWAGLA